jgi:hypothetical protein
MLPSSETIRKAVEQLQVELRNEHFKDGPYLKVWEERDEALGRYQPVFTTENIGYISKEEFRDFLMLRNNKHWSGLQRMGPGLTEDMDKLREMLKLLVDDSIPIQKRLDTILPKRGAKVKKLGQAVVTCILLIAFPDKYGVMNGKSVRGAVKLGIYPNYHRGSTFGERYVLFNEILLDLSRQLVVDLWTLDNLWDRLLKED